MPLCALSWRSQIASSAGWGCTISANQGPPLRTSEVGKFAKVERKIWIYGKTKWSSRDSGEDAKMQSIMCGRAAARGVILADKQCNIAAVLDVVRLLRCNFRHDQSFSAAPRWEVNFPLAGAPSMWKTLKQWWPMQAICFPMFSLQVGLTMGTNYRICVDMDGSDVLSIPSIPRSQRWLWVEWVEVLVWPWPA